MTEEKTNSKPLNTEEAAEYLRMPIGNLYKLTSQGRITHYKPQGGRIYFQKEDLEKFIHHGKIEADFELEERATDMAARRRL